MGNKQLQRIAWFLIICLSVVAPSFWGCSAPAHAVDRTAIRIVVFNLESEIVSREVVDTLVLNIEDEFYSISLFQVTSRQEILAFTGMNATSLRCNNYYIRRQARKKFRLDFVICGKIQKEGSKFILILEMVDLDSGARESHIKQGCRNCSVHQLEQAISQATRSLIRRYLDENRKDIHALFPTVNVDILISSLRTAQPSRPRARPRRTETIIPRQKDVIPPTIPIEVIPTATVSVVKPEKSASQIKEKSAIQQEGHELPITSTTPQLDTQSGLAILDFQKATKDYEEKRLAVIFILLFFMLFIASAIVLLNHYRRKRLEITSSSSVITQDELRESDHPKGILRCAISQEQRETESYIFAPPMLVIGYDPFEDDELQKPHLNIALHPAVGENINKSKLVDLRQAKLDFNHREITFTDLGSQNGSFINNEKLEPGERYSLENNDIIGLAGVHELQLTIARHENNDIIVAFLKRLNNASEKIMYILLVDFCYFALGEEYHLEWNEKTSDDALLKIFFKGKNFWLQSLLDYPPVILDSERISAGSKRRIARLQSTVQIQNMNILIDDLTVTL